MENKSKAGRIFFPLFFGDIKGRLKEDRKIDLQCCRVFACIISTHFTIMKKGEPSGASFDYFRDGLQISLFASVGDLCDHDAARECVCVRERELVGCESCLILVKPCQEISAPHIPPLPPVSLSIHVCF